MAHRVVNGRGASVPAVRSRNWRLPSAEMVVLSAPMSAVPEDERMPSSSRALSFSVWSRPIIQVPALATAL